MNNRPLRVLITGATGFLGSAIARDCVDAGIEVMATCRKHSSIERLGKAADKITFIDTSSAAIETALNSEFICDAIIHTATCYGREDETWAMLHEANCTFPLNLLEKAIACKVGLFLNTDTVLAPQINAYSLSKRQFAEWGRLATSKVNELRFVNVRMEHIYGSGDNPSKFVTYIIRQCLESKAAIPLTEGRQKRDFIHVSDAVTGIIKLLKAGAREELPIGWSEFDLGSGKPVTIRHLVNTVHLLTNSNVELCFGAVPYRDNEIMESSADTSLLMSLGWQCKVSLEQGLKNTIDFEERR